MTKRVQDHRFKERIKDLLSMHAAERTGTIFLMAILLVLASWVCYAQWFKTPPKHDLAPLQTKMDAWLAEKAAREMDTIALKPFPFDPNTIGREEWHALGLTDRQINGIEHYLEKGGRFRSKKDLGRMYTIKPEQYAALAPFILLPDSVARGGGRRDKSPPYPERGPRSSTIRERTPYEPYAPRKVEVNTADTTALVALPGIGPAFARGIVKYREVLGGYVSLDQLAEVYVLKDKPDAVLKLKELLILDTLMVRRIPINTCTVEELAAHPYLRWKLAKPLIAYRTQHGPFKTVADIRGCALIDEGTFRKLAPYLTVE